MKIMVSACLLGDNVKYNGKNNYNRKLCELLKQHEIFKICPEVMGGLSLLRDPAEIVKNKVLTKNGLDVTKEYIKGARIALKIAKDENIKVAILKSNSPSCGNHKIYDGTFTNNLISGEGVTAKLLRENEIFIFNENELDLIREFIR